MLYVWVLCRLSTENFLSLMDLSLSQKILLGREHSGNILSFPFKGEIFKRGIERELSPASLLIFD